MAINPNSLENLKGGGKPGTRKKLTKAYITSLMDYMVDDLPAFLSEIEQLELKDRVAAKLRIIEMVKPRDINLSFEDEDGEQTKPSWIINFIAPKEPITVDITPLEEMDIILPEEEKLILSLNQPADN